MCEIKNKIITKSTEMFLRLGFKSITMDDIAGEMSISKKTIYKFFSNKDLLIEESIALVHQEIANSIERIAAQNLNAIEENFELKRMFRELFKSAESSPIYQLKKHYPDIYEKALENQVLISENSFRNNINKGIKEGLYRENIDIENYVKFYYLLIFDINENTLLEKEAKAIETLALEYHIRAMATLAGIVELEKQLETQILH
ncbi:TetR/AcrR family transcriptional regulator [Flavobacterium psychraquaticum]|uniref:TetR/AcrR family transcriptional regulator n=1 Tax=Flavobacterium psychraquaticum TaxID=3103958 RepID=UPI002ACEE53A|nr:TetR/AcrR family transcriptional regulator [Flavobacterium sp. LB-N7T]